VTAVAVLEPTKYLLLLYTLWANPRVGGPSWYY